MGGWSVDARESCARATSVAELDGGNWGWRGTDVGLGEGREDGCCRSAARDAGAGGTRFRDDWRARGLLMIDDERAGNGMVSRMESMAFHGDSF